MLIGKKGGCQGNTCYGCMLQYGKPIIIKFEKIEKSFAHPYSLRTIHGTVINDKKRHINCTFHKDDLTPLTWKGRYEK